MRTLLFCVLLSACGEAKPRAFSLNFTPVAGALNVGCSDAISVGSHTARLSDLRFYVSQLRLLDAKGKPVAATLDENDFQQNGVTLIDLSSNTEGACASDAIAFGEGTARVHTALTGTTLVDEVVSVSFEIGIPQPIMRDIIASNTLEGAPSPFNEMYWSWASGYRHFVFNFTIEQNAARGEGYIHVGSRDCGAMGNKALSDRDTCGFINNPSVALSAFNLETNTVAVDLGRLLRDLPFSDMQVGCHSSPMQPDCTPVFSAFGLSMDDGSADVAANEIFKARN